jgi:hypothetical protein
MQQCMNAIDATGVRVTRVPHHGLSLACQVGPHSRGGQQPWRTMLARLVAPWLLLLLLAGVCSGDEDELAVEEQQQYERQQRSQEVRTSADAAPKPPSLHRGAIRYSVWASPRLRPNRSQLTRALNSQEQAQAEDANPGAPGAAFDFDRSGDLSRGRWRRVHAPSPPCVCHVLVIIHTNEAGGRENG